MHRVLAAVVIALAGCSEASPEPERAPENIGSLPLELRGQRPIHHAAGDYFANLKAHGSGCAAGTWDAAISDDGETFTLRFNAYEAQVDPGKALDVKDCQLEIDLSSAEGTSYSVASFYYQGYVLLEKDGMESALSTRYDFRGGHWDESHRRWFQGPFDDSYLFVDEIEMPRRAWSSCRRDETLRVNTRLTVQNDRNRTGSGYMNQSSVDSTRSDSTVSFRWKLQHKRCT